MISSDISTDLSIREASDRDGPRIGRLIAGVFAEYEGCLYEASEFPELEAIATHFGRRGGAIWVVEEGGRILGSLAVAPTHEGGVLELFKLYVDKGLRGRGVAKALLERALDFARQRGGTALALWTDTRFVDGHRFYERNGFVREPGIRALHDASRSLEYRYRRRLGA